MFCALQLTPTQEEYILQILMLEVRMDRAAESVVENWRSGCVYQSDLPVIVAALQAELRFLDRLQQPQPDREYLVAKVLEEVWYLLP